MKLTTPEMASEPYTADEPPVTVSTRFTSAAGIVLTSVVKSGPVMAKRRPFTSTRLRVGPRLRRLSVDVPDGWPGCTVFAVGLLSWFAVNCGVSDSITSRFCVPVNFSSCASTVVTGVGARKPRLARREPVTTTLFSSGFGASASCAFAWQPRFAAISNADIVVVWWARARFCLRLVFMPFFLMDYRWA